MRDRSCLYLTPSGDTSAGSCWTSPTMIMFWTSGLTSPQNHASMHWAASSTNTTEKDSLSRMAPALLEIVLQMIRCFGSWDKTGVSVGIRDGGTRIAVSVNPAFTIRAYKLAVPILVVAQTRIRSLGYLVKRCVMVWVLPVLVVLCRLRRVDWEFL